jgi:hypothetical protein
MLVSTRANRRDRRVRPEGLRARNGKVPQGAEEADPDSIVRIVRDQIGHGAEWVKLYADFRWGPNGETMPDVLARGLKLAVETARSSGVRWPRMR